MWREEKRFSLPCSRRSLSGTCLGFIVLWVRHYSYLGVRIHVGPCQAWLRCNCRLMGETLVTGKMVFLLLVYAFVITLPSLIFVGIRTFSPGYPSEMRDRKLSKKTSWRKNDMIFSSAAKLCSCIGLA